MHTSSLSHRAMFSTWLESKINQFLVTLQHDLDAGAKKQSLDSILSQAMYFGQSLGRVGADFRPSLARILSRYKYMMFVCILARHCGFTKVRPIETVQDWK